MSFTGIRTRGSAFQALLTPLGYSATLMFLIFISQDINHILITRLIYDTQLLKFGSHFQRDFHLWVSLNMGRLQSQCDQICQFLIALDKKISYKINQINLAYIEKNISFKLKNTTFWAFFGKVGLLFILISGHSGLDDQKNLLAKGIDSVRQLKANKIRLQPLICAFCSRFAMLKVCL